MSRNLPRARPRSIYNILRGGTDLSSIPAKVSHLLASQAGPVDESARARRFNPTPQIERGKSREDHVLQRLQQAGERAA